KSMENIILKYVFIPLSCAFFLFSAATDSIGAERITAQELKAMIDAKENVVLIDVRTPQEHKEAHIPGSILMPLDTLGSVDKLPGNGKHIIYCRSGKRSLTAIDILSAKGFKNLTDLKGGIIAWTTIGGPVVSGQSR
ncbi:MAG: rhodanese-like domain-containing protein, partial [Deltaproteobacteria bacterium]|nr:rhodanese-like domain-containing protein [Deltaproteobacteria bacterium]